MTTWTCPHGPLCRICTRVDEYVAAGNLRVKPFRGAPKGGKA